MDQSDKSDVIVSNSETIAQPRENLINTAVKFLQNPRVMQTTLAQRKAFLQKKGLTSVEISLAVEKAGLTDDKIQIPVQTVAAQSPVPFKSLWSVFAGIAALGGFSFGFYKLYKVFISPYFVHVAKEKDQLERLDASIRDLSLTLKQTMDQIQESIRNLHEANEGKGTMGEIRSELNIIKGLMLNRRHFPPAPSASLIPSWQLESSTSKLAVSTTSAISSAEIVDSSDISPVSSSSQSSSPPHNDSLDKKACSDEDTEVIDHGDIPESHLTDDDGKTSQ